jgi:hypothetical protein
MVVPIGFDRDLYESGGIKHKVCIDLKTRAMILIVGATGQGKTYATRYLLANMAKCDPAMLLTLIDVKNFDFFPDFSDCPRCYNADTALIGIKRYNDEYNEIVSAGRSENLTRRILLVDEWAAFASMAAFEKKKTADDGGITVKEAMAIVARLLMTGRAYAHTVIIGCQRAQADLFPSGGARDNFLNILHMGNFSKEQKIMLASDYSDEIVNDCGVGQGYLIQAGKPIRRILIPEYNVDRANELIRGALQD